MLKRTGLLHESVVESVLSKIPASERQSVSKELIIAANDKYRLLSVKAAQPGQLGKGDSQESRAALILEQVVRMDGSRQKLSLQMLAKVVGVHRKHLEALQLKMENYLTETTPCNNRYAISSKGIGKSDSGRSKSSSGSIASNSTRSLRSEQQLKPSSIPQLCIKLGSLLDDSHGVCRLAQKLYQDIQNHIQTSNTINEHMRRDYKADWARWQTAYEAVCFFLIATSSVGKSSKSEPSLHVHDVLDVSGVTSLLWRQILPTAESFRQAVEREKEQALKQSLKRGQGDRLITAAQKKVKSTGGTANARSKQSTSNATAARLLHVTEMTVGDDNHPVKSNTSAWPRQLDLPPLSLQYIEKRDDIVRKAIERQQLKAKVDEGDNISAREAKRRACQEVMTKLGLYNEEQTSYTLHL